MIFLRMCRHFKNINNNSCFKKNRFSLFSVETRSHLTLKKCMNSWNVMFFGSDEFSLRSLKAIFKETGPGKLINLLEVVTLDNKQNLIRKFAEENQIKVHLWPPPCTNNFHIGVVVSFGKLIPQHIIESFPLGMINVHGSLLPRWRGSSPAVHAILNGDTTTGISIMQIKPKKFDIGEIIMQKSCSIGQNELMPCLREKLSNIGAQLLLETLKTLPECLKEMKKQCEENATFAPQVKKSIAVVKWNDLTALQIYNLYRALYGMYDLKTSWHGKPCKLICVFLPTDNINFSESNLPGDVNYSFKNKILRVRCKEGEIYVCTLRINNKTISAKDFHSGYLTKRPKTEWRFR